MYSQSLNGIKKLPFKHRFPIMLASNLYQKIGSKIKHNTEKIWKKRVYVTLLEKIFITLDCFVSCIFLTSINKVKIHDIQIIDDYIKGILLKIK